MWKTPKRSRFILHQFSSPRPLFKIIFWCIHPTQWHLFCIFLLVPLAPGRNCPETCKCLKKITCGQMTLFKAFSFHFGCFSDHFWIILDPKPQSWSLDQIRPGRHAGSKNLYFPRDQSAKKRPKNGFKQCWDSTVLSTMSNPQFFSFPWFIKWYINWGSNDCKLYLLGQGLDMWPIRVLNDASYHIHW